MNPDGLVGIEDAEFRRVRVLGRAWADQGTLFGSFRDPVGNFTSLPQPSFFLPQIQALPGTVPNSSTVTANSQIHLDVVTLEDFLQ